MLAGTSASSLRVQITLLAWLLQEQAAGQEVAGGEPPPAADVMATPPPPAPRGGEKSQRKSSAPWGQDILPGGSGGHWEPRAHAILNAHAPRGRWGAARGKTGEIRSGTGWPGSHHRPGSSITTSLPGAPHKEAAGERLAGRPQLHHPPFHVGRLSTHSEEGKTEAGREEGFTQGYSASKWKTESFRKVTA